MIRATGRPPAPTLVIFPEPDGTFLQYIEDEYGPDWVHPEEIDPGSPIYQTDGLTTVQIEGVAPRAVVAGLTRTVREQGKMIWRLQEELRHIRTLLSVAGNASETSRAS